MPNDNIKSIKDIPIGQVWKIEPSPFESLITGVIKCGVFPDGRGVMLYTDGSREEVKLTEDEANFVINQTDATFLPIVSLIQSKRTTEAGNE